MYHEYAEEMPIFDYHCHLIPREIAENRRWDNLTQIWLGGDHYKWRARPRQFSEAGGNDIADFARTGSDNKNIDPVSSAS